MKKMKKYSLIAVLWIISINGFAQPYTLDKELKPIELVLLRDVKYEGVKYLQKEVKITNNVVQHYYVTGCDIDQYIDVFIFANRGNPSLKVEIATTSWKDIVETKNTTAFKDGIINFKLRSYKDFGLRISSKNIEDVTYSIVVNTSKPVKKHLESPFVKATKTNASSNLVTSFKEEVPTTISLWVYTSIGILILIVGLLADKILRKKKNLLILILLLGMGNELLCQTEQSDRSQSIHNKQEREHQQRRIDNSRSVQVGNRINSLNDAISTTGAEKNVLDKYVNLNKCMNSTPLSNQPRIPSFCVGEENSCSNCFLDARREFNTARYKIEKLQIIYDCTVSYTDLAIKARTIFGDLHSRNCFPPYIDLARNAERKRIMNSRADLNKNYDDKRAEFLEKLKVSLIKLDACEEEHGLTDWYDRFGVLFYEFIEMKYNR